MRLRNINPLLDEHRRHWWWPRRCRCGEAHPCDTRGAALDEAYRMYAARVDEARRQAERLPDGDVVPVAGFARYADLLGQPPPARAVGRASVPVHPSLVRPFVTQPLPVVQPVIDHTGIWR